MVTVVEDPAQESVPLAVRSRSGPTRRPASADGESAVAEQPSLGLGVAADLLPDFVFAAEETDGAILVGDDGSLASR